IEPASLSGFSRRLVAIKLLEGDDYIPKSVAPTDSLLETVKELQAALMEEHGDTPDAVFAAERHHLAMHIFEESAVVHRRPYTRTNKIDDFLMHPFWGYALMLLILLLYFNGIFKFGAWIEAPLMDFLSVGIVSLTEGLDSASLWAQIVRAALQGIAGGIAIVLPYLLPFLIGMAIIEDVGYLPRIAFLMDSFMHRIGLHGVAVIPGLLGYGCSVPAIMATRILSSPRDRFIASVIAVLVPCSARMVVIMGLVGYYLGGTAAAGIYLFNLIVVSLLGALLARLMPEDVPGMILEMPAYHRPRLKVVLLKSWLRLKDFILIAWPLLIIGSIILGLAEWFDLNGMINLLTRPITWLLDLPEAVGVTLIFGVLRKELSLLMLFQALGTQDVSAVLSKTQILTLTLFVVFYIPCLATLGIMGREIGWKKTAAVALVAFILSLVIALLGRSVGWVLFG
ncbi:MAG: ferrous iron transporter B, partial [Calditrichaeota bacterium]